MPGHRGEMLGELCLQLLSDGPGIRKLLSRKCYEDLGFNADVHTNDDSDDDNGGDDNARDNGDNDERRRCSSGC